MAKPTPPTGPTQAQQDARTIVDQYLKQIGLGSVPGTWVWNEITGSGLTDSAGIAAKLELDLQNTTWFKAAFPGLEERTKNGFPAMNVADYLSYESQAYSLARAAGLPQGFMDKALIGEMIGKDVSMSELTARINDGYEAATTAAPEVRAEMQNYGLEHGDLAAFFLDPTRAEPLLMQKFTAAQIGAAGVEAGFGEIGLNQASHLAQLGVSQAQAISGFGQIAPLAGLETQLPGGHGPTVTGQQLLAAQFEGSGTAQLAVQHAQESREAPAKGGGGFAGGQEGVTGAGFGQS